MPEVFYFMEQRETDPAFLWFPGDWLGGTMTFTRLEKGAYIDLLMAQHSTGHMTMEEIEVVLGPDIGLWEKKLRKKFKQDADGNFYNQKLEREMQKRAIFTNSRRRNLTTKGANEANSSHMDSHMGTHMGNGNGIIDSKGGMGGILDLPSIQEAKAETTKHIQETRDLLSRNKKSGGKKVPFVPPTLNQVKEFMCNDIEAQLFFNHYTATGWISGSTPIQDWKSKASNWLINEVKFRGNGKSKSASQDAGKKLGTSEARTKALKDWGLKPGESPFDSNDPSLDS